MDCFIILSHSIHMLSANLARQQASHPYLQEPGMSEHTNKQFDSELENVRSDFLRMVGLVEAMIGSAIDALIEGDTQLVDKVREH